MRMHWSNRDEAAVMKSAFNCIFQRENNLQNKIQEIEQACQEDGGTEIIDPNSNEQQASNNEEDQMDEEDQMYEYGGDEMDEDEEDSDYDMDDVSQDPQKKVTFKHYC